MKGTTIPIHFFVYTHIHTNSLKNQTIALSKTRKCPAACASKFDVITIYNLTSPRFLTINNMYLYVCCDSRFLSGKVFVTRAYSQGQTG